MKTVQVEIEDKVDELLVCLDKDIEHLQKSLLSLDELRSLVIKRNDAALGRLLESIQAESDSYREHELKRQSIRKELAKSLGCSVKDVTLTKLKDSITEAKQARIIECKAKLKLLVEKLKKEYSSTAILLSECARFNNLLLKSIFNLGDTGAVYYNAMGATKRQNESAFVNMKF